MEEIEYQLARLRYELAEISDDDGGTHLEIVGEGPHPELVFSALSQYSIGDLTRVFRAFVDERVSIRNMTEILERLVQYDTIPFEQPGRLILLDDRIPEQNGPSRARSRWRSHYEFCRKQLRSELSHRHSWGENTIVAYLLEPAIEARAQRLAAAVRSGGPRSSAWEREAEAFRDAVWRELHFVGPGPVGQVVLTTPAARPAVRALLESELPGLPVISYAELRPDVNVQPIARVLVGAD
jgi:type III secretion protein V